MLFQQLVCGNILSELTLLIEIKLLTHSCIFVSLRLIVRRHMVILVENAAARVDIGIAVGDSVRALICDDLACIPEDKKADMFQIADGD